MRVFNYLTKVSIFDLESNLKLGCYCSGKTGIVMHLKLLTYITDMLLTQALMP